MIIGALMLFVGINYLKGINILAKQDLKLFRVGATLFHLSEVALLPMLQMHAFT